MAALEDQELDLDKDTTENPRDNMTDVMVIRQFCQTLFYHLINKLSKCILFSHPHILFSLLQGHYNKLSEEEKQILEALMNDEGQIPSNIGIMNCGY